MDLWNFCSEHEAQVEEITQRMQQQHYFVEESELIHQELYSILYNISISDSEYWNEICSMICFCEEEMEMLSSTTFFEEEKEGSLNSSLILESRDPSSDFPFQKQHFATPSFSTPCCTVDFSNQYDHFYWKEAFSIPLRRKQNQRLVFTQLQGKIQKKEWLCSNLTPFAWLWFKFKFT